VNLFIHKANWDLCRSLLLTDNPVFSSIKSLSNTLDILLIDEPFTEATPQDELLQSVSIIVCCPISTLSAVSNPVDYILQDGG